jgi:hypothetical protein
MCHVPLPSTEIASLATSSHIALITVKRQFPDLQAGLPIASANYETISLEVWAPVAREQLLEGTTSAIGL